MRHNIRLNSKAWRALFSPLLLIFALLVFVSPVAAQTNPTATRGAGGGSTLTQTTQQQFTDTPQDIINGLSSQGYYISQSAKANIKEANLENSIKDTVSKLKGDKHDTRVAIVGSQILNAAPQSKGSAATYADFLLSYLNNPKPEIVIVVNAENKTVGLATSKLSASERQSVINSSLSTFNSSYANGVRTLADGAVNKIEGNERGSAITTGVIVLVVVLLIGGAVFFMYNNTKKTWQQRLADLQGLAGQVSNQVLNLNDTIEYLPDAVRNRTRELFGQASSTYSNANNSLRQLEKATPWALLFSGGKYQRQLEMTASQFQTSRNALAQVQQTVDSSTHM
jgi:hypothetical protein